MLSTLHQALRGKPCRAYGSDVKVRVEAVDAYYYPDVLVTCSPKDLSADQVMSEPRVLVEVLSPSTASYDRGLKFAAYRQLPSLEQYLLIDPAELTVESYQRTEGGNHGGTGGGAWLLRDVPRGGEIAMPALGLRLSWADVFRYVDPLVAEGD
jgi:Uma2 family endonuclease